MTLVTFGTIEQNGVIHSYDPETFEIGRVLGEKGIETDNILFDILFIGKGIVNGFVKNRLKTTAHGVERLAGTATRGGVLSKAEVQIVKRTAEKRLIQTDGAIVYLRKNTAGRFDVVVEGSKGLITTI